MTMASRSYAGILITEPASLGTLAQRVCVARQRDVTAALLAIAPGFGFTVVVVRSRFARCPRFSIHSWNDDGTINVPWMHPEVTRHVADLIKLRSGLIPYLYELLW